MNSDKSTFFKSAFKTVYFAVFVFVTYKIISHAETFSVVTDNQLDTDFFKVCSQTFLWLVGIHTIRLYITLEMLDEEKFLFENFFQKANGLQRFFEIGLRWFIIGAVSYKFIDWSGGGDIHRYLIVLYAALVVWGVISLTFNSFSKSYLGISLPGLFLSCLIFFMSNKNFQNNIGIWSALIAIACLAIIFDLTRDIIKNWTVYKEYIFEAKNDFLRIVKLKS